jgi:hypothetical protein
MIQRQNHERNKKRQVLKKGVGQKLIVVIFSHFGTAWP